MLSLQALALVVYALGRDMWLAIGAAFLVFFTRAAEHGVVYPIVLMGMEHTYGAVGLFVVVLTVGLLSAGASRTGGFLLGVAPSIHPSLGVWLWVIVVAAFVWDFKRLAVEHRPAFPYLVAGAVVTVLSFGIHSLSAVHATGVDPAVVSNYLSAFTRFWDGHRRPVDLESPGVALNRDALIVAGVWLLACRDRVSRNTLFLLRVVLVSAVAGFLFILLSWAPPERVPEWLLILMPARLLNFNAMVLPALLIGLLAIRRDLAGAVLTLVLAAGLFVSRPSMWWDRVTRPPALDWLPRLDQMVVLQLAAIVLFLLGLVAWWRHGSAARPPEEVSRRPVIVTGARLAVLALCVLAAAMTLRIRQVPRLSDRTNHVVFKMASEEQDGLMATGSGFAMIQLRTRRPVLLNSGALDTLSYAPDTAPEMARILRDVYDLDLLNPPRGVPPGLGAIPPDYNKEVWEQFTRARWQEIKRTYRVTQVLTAADTDLDLPVAAQFESFRLYRVP
jgi:hypothetical protein